MHSSKSLHAAHGAFLISQSRIATRASQGSGPLWGCIQVNPSMLRMARLFCFHPSLKQALFGVETKNPDQFPGRDLFVRMKGLEPSRRSTSA